MVATPQGAFVPYIDSCGGQEGRGLIDTSWQDVFADQVGKTVSNTHLLTYALHQSKKEVMQESGVWLSVRASHPGNIHLARRQI